MKKINIVLISIIAIAVTQYPNWSSGETRPLTVTIVLPLTGPASYWGEQLIKDIKNVIPLLSPHIKLTVKDVPKLSSYHIQNLVEIEKAKIVIGPALDNTLPIMEHYQESLGSGLEISYL